MRSANVLDVLKAVTAVAPSHRGVAVWWYAPLSEFDRGGDGEQRPRHYEVVVECRGDPPDLEGLERDLSERLFGQPVRVRVHRGDQEERQLFRMLTMGRPHEVR